ncbi:DUF6434 domain-containing protein [Roseivirga misakiensis]|uniref:DUF6434 domain-containing protein n=1 Tax=Roseivirga misakiensis TaxID=1563681 RepID=A0A1E5SKT8_9BACT|nr:DUF6434 domain-containing protein [Roseivirga misakiensis]OEJ99740.1 hypothetical protein BFP71_09230 [Roseivirga misakiensis]
MQRPDFTQINSGQEFNNWYWTKEEMVDICKMSHLPSNGSKFILRDRIMYALDHEGQVKNEEKKIRPNSTFNWAKAELSLATKITDNVSFGPNFRSFMSSQVDKKFSCHSDFMNWVKENVGATLQDAVLKWEELEERKKDPNFKRDIATNNMYCQYIRDFSAANPNAKFVDAKACWNKKRRMPMKNGFVRFEESDILLKD